jgi:cytoskeletal protein RodZ
MTTGKPTQRAQRGFPGKGGKDTGTVTVGRNSTLPEQLRSAREAKGVDLYRVERDTKIRSKYLAALENGDYGDLPGEVYTRGFIRNYASYLGIDPDEAVDEWRRERGESEAHQPMIGGPKPMAMPRRSLVLQPSHIFVILLAVVVLGVASYFGLQVTRFLQYPSVSVINPSTDSFTVGAGTTTYRLTGTATAGTEVFVSWDSQLPKSTTVDSTGHWAIVMTLHSGRNQFDITATNADTNHSSVTITRYIEVPLATPTPSTPQISVTSPREGDTVQDGAVTVSGISASVANVTVTPVYLGPPPSLGSSPTPIPSITPVPSPTATPKPTPVVTLAPGATPGPTSPPPGTTAKVAVDGSFSVGLQLTPGRWQLNVTGASAAGVAAAPVAVTIVVPYKGIQVLVEIEGGPATLKIWRDGVLDTKDSKTYQSGDRIQINANAKVRLTELADEIISLLVSDPNATVKVTVEIDAEFPNGASDQIKRAVSENANSLGLKNKTWE